MVNRRVIATGAGNVSAAFQRGNGYGAEPFAAAERTRPVRARSPPGLQRRRAAPRPQPRPRAQPRGARPLPGRPEVTAPSPCPAGARAGSVGSAEGRRRPHPPGARPRERSGGTHLGPGPARRGGWGRRWSRALPGSASSSGPAPPRLGLRCQQTPPSLPPAGAAAPDALRVPPRKHRPGRNAPTAPRHRGAPAAPCRAAPRGAGRRDATRRGGADVTRRGQSSPPPHAAPGRARRAGPAAAGGAMAEGAGLGAPRGRGVSSRSGCAARGVGPPCRGCTGAGGCGAGGGAGRRPPLARLLTHSLTHGRRFPSGSRISRRCSANLRWLWTSFAISASAVSGAVGGVRRGAALRVAAAAPPAPVPELRRGGPRRG